MFKMRMNDDECRRLATLSKRFGISQPDIVRLLLALAEKRGWELLK